MSGEAILIKHGTVIDPGNQVHEPLDLLIEGGKIAELGKNLNSQSAVTIDAKGKIVTPGLIDIHVHFREPGGEPAETIASGAAAAVAGGFTTVCCMPNTLPALDNQAQLEFILQHANQAGYANVLPISAVTKGRRGEELVEMGLNSEAGAIAFSDDGANIDRADVMMKALQYAKMVDKVIMVHAEDCHLSGGVMSSGYTSTRLGLPGIPKEAEDVIVARDILLAKMTGGRVHIAHVSSKETVMMIRQAKEKGCKITCETAPHYFKFCDEDIEHFGTMLKMNPPLGGREDRDAIIEGLQDGTIEVIASDHAPHAAERKALGMINAPFGVIGLETMVPVTYTELVLTEILTMDAMIASMTCNPARILPIPNKGTLSVGADADVAIFDFETEWLIDKNRFKSKSRNCPFHNMKVKGRATDVLVNGKHFQNQG